MRLFLKITKWKIFLRGRWRWRVRWTTIKMRNWTRRRRKRILFWIFILEFLQWPSSSKIIPFLIYFIYHGLYSHEIFTKVYLISETILLFLVWWHLSSLSESSPSNLWICFYQFSLISFEFSLGYHAHSQSNINPALIPLGLEF